ncbi:LANO_0G08526g1_1 [Lachancea nothofagi CBS 11611]|uniref:Kinase n=1 Tax=Lachancea nothofagi CBS 11611 TaxID=1266666 RepID=A0A1G4KHX7_9SACH|nr:LANO_0G08526g1_1 [Lachancea nothofagi CBS 11611]
MAGNYAKARHQAAGHDGNYTDVKETLFFKPTTSTELEFYQNIQGRNSKITNDQDVTLESWMPIFLGSLTVGIPENFSAPAVGQSCDPNLTRNIELLESNPELASKEKPVIVLENLLQGYKAPNILDVKLGKILYDDAVSTEKKLRLQKVSDETTSGSLGLRICGMNIQNNSKVRLLNQGYFEHESGGYVAVNKFYGRSLNEKNIIEGFELFLANDAFSDHHRAVLSDIFLKRLIVFYNTLIDEEVRLISTSLLFIYEGDTARWEEADSTHSILKEDFVTSCSDEEEGEGEGEVENDKHKCLSSLSLIDFAHSRTVPGEGLDENVVTGVESLMNIFEDLNSKRLG